MVVGIPPFYHQNQMTMFQIIKKSEIKFPSQISISEKMKDLIKKVFFFFICFKPDLTLL